MSLLIDGYNVLHETGILRGGIGPGKLQQARQALLNFVANSIAAEELERTTIVFDAKEAPPGAARVTRHAGMTILYAVAYEDADELIEELIATHSTPRQLLVVSSDRRLQKAAKRRRARALSSQQWYEQLVRQRAHEAAPEEVETKPPLPLSEAEVQRWLEQFAGETQPEEEPGGGTKRADLKPSEPAADDIGNPFPPGYGEELL